MYSPLKLYYLQQLGIRPWVKKELPAIVPKVVVIVPSFLSEKANQLLSHILECLPKENVVVFSTEHMAIKRMPSLVKAVLLFDTDLLQDKLTCPLFKIADLEALLTKPLLKKDVFKTLQQLAPLLML